MFSDEGIGAVDAERKFWATPELVEKLLPFLDLESIKQLAKSHKLTRQILGKSFIWNQLIKRIFLKDHNIDPQCIPVEGDAVLASEIQKLLSEILSLSEDSDRSQLGMDLIHTICERHGILEPDSSRRLVDVGCSCGKTHTVSFLGFLLLKEVQAREQGILFVDRVEFDNGVLEDPLLTALSSLVAKQQDKVKKLGVDEFQCHNKESAEAIATLVERSQTVNSDGVNHSFLFIEDQIEAEGWSAIRRAVELLSGAFGKEIYMTSTRKLREGRKCDLKAIWDNVRNWDLNGDDGDRFLEFWGSGGGVGWKGEEGQRRGIEDVIDMTEEEWLEELSKYGEEYEDSEEQDEMGQEEGEKPRPQ